MNELKKQGIAVMFVSSEMPEVMGIADRIIVMCDGRITGEVSAREATQDEILTMATSFENKVKIWQCQVLTDAQFRTETVFFTILRSKHNTVSNGIHWTVDFDFFTIHIKLSAVFRIVKKTVSVRN